MQQAKKEILKSKVSFELGLISLLSVSLFFMLQIVNVEAYGSNIYSVLAGDADSTSPSAQKYALTVTNGTGSDLYVEGSKVTITANPAISEKVFDKWTGDTEYVANVNAAATVVTMPAKAIALTASYKTVPSAQKYNLTVKNGTGSGSYTEGSKIAIAANPTISKKIFSKWTGDTKYVADPASATTTVTMPGKAITLVANYKTIPSTKKYVLSIKNGTGSGSYAKGTQVTITANPAISEKIFSRWTGNTKYISDPTAATTTITMPAKAIRLVANYKTVPSDEKYILNVKNGTGSGSYTEGAKVTITAAVSAEKVFSKWTGDTKYIADPASATTTVIMPNKAITLTAVYKFFTLTQSLKTTVTSMDTKVEKGAKDVTLVEASLINTGTETLAVSGLGIMADFGGSSVNNVKLYLDGKDMGSPAKIKAYEVIYKSLPFQIEAGKTVKLVLKGDISSKIRFKGLGFRLDSCPNILTVKGVTSGKKAKFSVSGKSYLYFVSKEN